jgi:hypothetical protein
VHAALTFSAKIADAMLAYYFPANQLDWRPGLAVLMDVLPVAVLGSLIFCCSYSVASEQCKICNDDRIVRY